MNIPSKNLFNAIGMFTIMMGAVAVFTALLSGSVALKVQQSNRACVRPE